MKSATENVNGGQVWKQTFNYDRYGNRTFDAANTTTLAVNDKVTNPVIDSATNRIAKDQGGGVDYDYDRNGSLILDARVQRFVYDAENRIKEFFRGSNGGTVPDATYEYDGNANRVRKVVDNEQTIFVYNGMGRLVAEYSPELASTPRVGYLTTDHLGSPRVVTDETGAVVARHDYLAFGEDLSIVLGDVGGRDSTKGYGIDDKIRKKYTGYEHDNESALDYAQARYYNSSHGRFTSSDPLMASADVKNPQTFNRYSYVLNSPYKFTDPLGLISVNSAACGSWCNGGEGGMYGMGIGLYLGLGMTVQIGSSEQLQSPPQFPTAPQGPEEVEVLSGHLEFKGILAGSEIASQGNVVFYLGDYLDGGQLESLFSGDAPFTVTIIIGIPYDTANLPTIDNETEGLLMRHQSSVEPYPSKIRRNSDEVGESRSRTEQNVLPGGRPSLEETNPPSQISFSEIQRRKNKSVVEATFEATFFRDEVGGSNSLRVTIAGKRRNGEKFGRRFLVSFSPQRSPKSILLKK